MWISNDEGFFIQAIHGACFVSWVNTRDKANALVFPALEIESWLIALADMTGEHLRAVEPYA